MRRLLARTGGSGKRIAGNQLPNGFAYTLGVTSGSDNVVAGNPLQCVGIACR